MFDSNDDEIRGNTGTDSGTIGDPGDFGVGLVIDSGSGENVAQNTFSNTRGPEIIVVGLRAELRGRHVTYALSLCAEKRARRGVVGSPGAAEGCVGVERWAGEEREPRRGLDGARRWAGPVRAYRGVGANRAVKSEEPAGAAREAYGDAPRVALGHTEAAAADRLL